MQHAELNADCTACSVRATSFCGAIPLRGLNTLARSRRLVQYDRRQTIVSEGEPATSFFSIVSGVVKLCRSLSDGRTQIIGFRFPGEYFAISDSENYATTVEAMTFVEACQFPRSRLKRLTQAFPQMQARLLDMSHRYLAASEDQIFLLGRKTAKEKVASFLLSYSEKFAQESAGSGHRMNLPMTRAEIADFLGLTTETVSRVLTGLAREKVITVGLSHSVRLLNVNLLQRIAGHWGTHEGGPARAG
jgi:CRP/FNR family transcriptional regulator